jgi:hypothetical protein
VSKIKSLIEKLLDESDEGIIEGQIFLQGGGAFQGALKRGDFGLYEMLSIAQVGTPGEAPRPKAFRVFVDPAAILGFMVAFDEHDEHEGPVLAIPDKRIISGLS